LAAGDWRLATGGWRLGLRIAVAVVVARTAALRLGEIGEELACAELERRGYVILARRYRTRVGEIDIVARDGPTVVFVEVKTRENVAFGHPAEAVTWWKQQRIAAMAADFRVRRRMTMAPCRFDVVAITWPRDGRPGVEIIRGAFAIDS
jgi:putative endonuclease